MKKYIYRRRRRHGFYTDIYISLLHLYIRRYPITGKILLWNSEAVAKKSNIRFILALIAKRSRHWKARKAAVENEKLTNRKVLAYVAKNDKDSDVRKAAVRKVTVRSVLVDIAKNDIDSDVCKTAAYGNDIRENLKDAEMFFLEERLNPYEEVLSFEDFIEDTIDSVLIKGVIAKLCGKKYEIIDPELGYGQWIDKTCKKRSYGILEFYFPDPGREYGRWTGKSEPAPMTDIPLYREPGGKVFDALHFGLERFAPPKTTDVHQLPYVDWKQRSEPPVTVDEEYYVVSTCNGSSLRPYRLWHGKESAEAEAENRKEEILRKDDLNFYKSHLYRLWFRTIGEYRKGWYKVILDETTRKKAYIRKDDERLSFVTWEEEFCENMDTVNFHGHKLYDRTKGKLIEMDDDEKSYCCILQTEGDWMQVGKRLRSDMQDHLGWLRWRNDNGILPGIRTFNVVY